MYSQKSTPRMERSSLCGSLSHKLVTWQNKELGYQLIQCLWPTIPYVINSLTPGRFYWNFRYAIFTLMFSIYGWVISFQIAHRWLSQDFTDDKSTLVQVMAWYRQAKSHYLSQCCPRSLSPYGVTRPQWVKIHLSFIPFTYELIAYDYHALWERKHRSSWFFT